MLRGKYQRTEEHKKKMSRVQKALVTEESRKKNSEAQKDKKLSEETKLKIGKASKGHTLDEVARKKISLANLGKPKSPEHRKKLSELAKKRTGEKASNWKGGKSFEPYSREWKNTLKRAIRERDNYTCRICGTLKNPREFDVHHIDYDKKNCNPSNLITLCIGCHRKTNGNRESWKKLLIDFNQ